MTPVECKACSNYCPDSAAQVLNDNRYILTCADDRANVFADKAAHFSDASCVRALFCCLHKMESDRTCLQKSSQILLKMDMPIL